MLHAAVDARRLTAGPFGCGGAPPRACHDRGDLLHQLRLASPISLISPLMAFHYLRCTPCDTFDQPFANRVEL